MNTKSNKILIHKTNCQKANCKFYVNIACTFTVDIMSFLCIKL